MGGTAVGVVVATALVAQMSVVSNASWNDSEWVNAAPVGTVDCADPEGALVTRGEGALLSGALLGTDLDSIADVHAMNVTNDGTNSKPTPLPPSSTSLGDDAFSDPLDITALNLAHLSFGDLLQLPLETQTGVVGQYARAATDGTVVAASGTVVDGGGISLDQFEGAVPTLATLKLSELLNSPLLGDIGLGNTLSGVADLELELGAVAGQASLDACAQVWADTPQARTQLAAANTASDIIAGLDRRYLTATADLTFRSDTVGALVRGVNGTLNGLQGTINTLIGQQSVTTRIVNAVAALLNGVLGTLGLGSIGVKSLSATIDIGPVQSLLTTEFGDSGGVLTINPVDGTIRISTAALLAEAYELPEGSALNGLPPNTNLLQDPAVLTALTTSLTSVLGEWITSIQNTILEQVNAISVSAEVSIIVKLLVLNVAEITATVNGSLGDLLTGNVKAQASAKLLGLLDLGLLNPLLNALINGLGQTVGDILSPLFTTIHLLPSAVSELVTPIINLVSRLYTGLFLSNILSITVNAQNQPASGSPPPPDWADGQSTAPPDGQYEVAAIRIGVLDGLGPNGVRLYLGRASVGPGCSVLSSTQPGSPCAGF